MLKAGIIWFQFLMLTAVFGQTNADIHLTNSQLTTSLGNSVGVLCDSLNQYTSFDQIVQAPDDAFFKGTEPIINFDFTAARYWLKFSVVNESDFTHFIAEFGRPVTNKVEYYELENGQLTHSFISGDDFAYQDKEILHRKNIFRLKLAKGRLKHFI